MSQVPEQAAARKKKLDEAVKKENRSISGEIAALRAVLRRYRKDEPGPPKESSLLTDLGKLEKMWNDLRVQEKKENTLRKKADDLKKLRTETEDYLKTLPSQLFGTCLDLVKENQDVPAGFCTEISPEALEKAIKIEMKWR